jgi:hypothetical protein
MEIKVDFSKVNHLHNELGHILIVILMFFNNLIHYK